MELDRGLIESIVGGNPRFLSAYDESEPYFIWDEAGTAHTEPDGSLLSLFYNRLRYAAEHADELIDRAFREEFLGFYGVDGSKVRDGADMRSRLVFESFSMNARTRQINTYLSDSGIMRGHYIEVYWTEEWQVDMYTIC